MTHEECCRRIRVVLWGATLMVILFAVFRSYVGVFLGGSPEGPGIDPERERAGLTVDGMDSTRTVVTLVVHGMKKTKSGAT